MADDLRTRLRAKIELQRHARGDYLTLGEADEELTDALAALDERDERIKAAYFEGFQHGHDNCSSDGDSGGCWETSNSRNLLTNPTPAKE